MPPDLAPSPSSASPAPPPVAPAKMLDPRPGAPVVSNPPTSDVHQRWKNDRDFIAAQDPWMHSPETTVMTKLADGTVVARPRTGADGAPDQPAPGEPPKLGDEPQPQPLNSNGKIQLTPDIALSETELRDLLAHKAQTDSQKLTTPKPNEYQLKFNDDFVLPQGTDWRWNEADPLLMQVREFASANNMNQQTFSRLLQMHAASRLGEDLAFSEAKAKELAALGDSSDQRIRAVVTWMKSMVPAEHAAGLVRVLEAAPTAGTVRAMESLIQRWTNQGAAGFKSGTGREPPGPAKASEAEIARMSYFERLQYAASHRQPNQ